jgi:hypothetical protein
MVELELGGVVYFLHFSFVPNMFLLCSLQVPNGFPSIPDLFPMFPVCSTRVFPIAARFNSVCFAQSPGLLTYIGGPKGEAIHLSNE